MTSVSLKGVKKLYGSQFAVHETDLEIKSGEFIVFVGPSGCGKSTLLRMISGLEDVSEGEILFDLKDMTLVPASKRGVAMVFQSYALYPHMTAEQNLSFGLRMTGHRKDEIERRVSRAVKMLRLENYLKRKPSQLSGGQCQRVAIGRALVQQPKVFLFDEPLSNLDAELRSSMRVEIAALHRELDNTMIYVTHDQIEAMTLADRIVVLNQGRIEQVGTPYEIYHKPGNMFVAEFMGVPKITVLTGTLCSAESPHLLLDSGDKIRLPISPSGVKAGATISIGIRPEDIALDDNSNLEFDIEFVEQIGASSNLFGNIGGHPIRVASCYGENHQPGDRLRISFNPNKIHFFDEHGNIIRFDNAVRAKVETPKHAFSKFGS